MSDVLEWISISKSLNQSMGFTGSSESKETSCNAEDVGLILGLGRSPGIATHSSVLGWEIPWTEETGSLQSMGLQRVRHN